MSLRHKPIYVMASSQPSQSRSTRTGNASSLASSSHSQTQTQTQTQTDSQGSIHPILVLRADGTESRHIQWAEDVVDNEGMGKKSSKVCCIYHKPHSANESSGDDSSSSDSSSDSDSEPDTTKARPGGKLKAGGRDKQRSSRRHNHNDEHAHDHPSGDSGQRRPSPNAYERVPKYKQPSASQEQAKSSA